MQTRHFAALMTLIVLPLIVIGWLGSAAVTRQQTQLTLQLRSVLTDRLVDADRKVHAVIAEYENDLGDRLRDAGRDPRLLRDLRLNHPAVRATLMVDREGRLIYPPPRQDNDLAKLSWQGALGELARRRPIIESDEWASSPPLQKAGKSPTKAFKSEFDVQPNAKQPTRQALQRRSIANVLANVSAGKTQWQGWFYDNGLQLVLWLPWSDQSATGIVMERGRWMADIASTLPSSDDLLAAQRQGLRSRSSVSPGALAPEPNTSRFVLRDGSGQMVTGWGSRLDDVESEGSSVVLANLRLSHPLGSWEFAYEADAIDFTPGWINGPTALAASLVAILATLVSLGGYLGSSLKRQMQLAQQRVSFASHVSHELKTPLTNIRLYAELARRDLEELASGDAESRLPARIAVIEEESQRLSRLVSGVLELVSADRKQGSLRLRNVVPDEIIQLALHSFAPSFDRLGIDPQLQLNAARSVSIDSDLLELILVNLFSNVEKYASDGGELLVRSKQSDLELQVDVIDRGPGISTSAAKKIFEPFRRLDDSLSAPAGTGLGLAIARNAARRHGGDLIWLPSQVGSHFRLTLSLLS